MHSHASVTKAYVKPENAYLCSQYYRPNEPNREHHIGKINKNVDKFFFCILNYLTHWLVFLVASQLLDSFSEFQPETQKIKFNFRLNLKLYLSRVNLDEFYWLELLIFYLWFTLKLSTEPFLVVTFTYTSLLCIKWVSCTLV